MALESAAMAEAEAAAPVRRKSGRDMAIESAERAAAEAAEAAPRRKSGRDMALESAAMAEAEAAPARRQSFPTPVEEFDSDEDDSEEEAVSEAEGEEDDGFVAYHSSDEGEDAGMPERRSSQTFLSDDEGADGLPEEFDDDDELSDTAEVL